MHTRFVSPITSEVDFSYMEHFCQSNKKEKIQHHQTTKKYHKTWCQNMKTQVIRESHRDKLHGKPGILKCLSRRFLKSKQNPDKAN